MNLYRYIRNIISESTSTMRELNPYIRDNEIAPALLTWGEYYNIVNEKDKYLESSAYDWGYSEDDKFNCEECELVNTINVNGLLFKFYLKKEKNNYSKWDGDEYVGVMSDEEMISSGLRLYSYNYYCVYDGITVGYAMDEWGCVLIVVVKEFRGFGIGERLVKYYRGKYPIKSSGGLSDNGYIQLRKYYNWMVRQTLSNGVYSDMVKNGEIDISRVREIISSVNKNYKFSKDKIRDEPTYLVPEKESPIYIIENNLIIIFDENIKKFKDVELNSVSDRVLRKHIYCYIYVNNYNGFAQVYDIYGDNKYLGQGIAIMSQLNNEGLGDYYFRNFNSDIVSKLNKIWNSDFFNKKVIKDKGYISSVPLSVISLKKDISPLIYNLKNNSKIWFKNNDKYDELYNFIIETAYGYAED